MAFPYPIVGKKADIFNKYFANQCTINNNCSVLPNSKTDTSLSHIYVSQEQIINIINTFHTAMLKICATEVAITLKLIFNDSINTGMFPDS